MGSNVIALPLEDLLKRASFRQLFTVGGLLVLSTLTFIAAAFLRFEFSLESSYWAQLLLTLPLLLATRWLGFILFDVNVRSFRRASVSDLLPIVCAVTASSLIFSVIIRWLTPELGFSRAIIIVDWALLQLGLFTVFAGSIVFREAPPIAKSSSQRAVLVGNKESVSAILRDVKESGRWNAVCAVTTDYKGARELLHGVPVTGAVKALLESAARYRANLVCLAHPGLDTRQLMELIKLCRHNNLEYVVVRPNTTDRSPVQELGTEMLLQRDEVSIDLNAVRKFIRGRRVLVTGAGGSIGSELCRQIAAFAPAALFLVERSENNLFFIHRELMQREPGVELHPLLLDITDEAVLSSEFEKAKPEIVFHAAAHKHVGMMEGRPQEAIRNNVVGTYNVASAAAKHGVWRFINISTDKAVRPKSYMGLSKRFAEQVIEEMNRIHGTSFVTVRFGNVAGSTGSVVQIFRQQIERGGPVTVTDSRARRFFMTIPEAVRLVLQAAVFSETTGIFVLDMGNPIEIYELARTMISLSGNVPNVDIPIEFTRLMSAEKMTEELQDEGEEVCKTQHSRVMVIRKQDGYTSTGFLMKVAQWRSLIRQGQFDALLEEVREAHPDFRRKEKVRTAAVGSRVSA